MPNAPFILPHHVELGEEFGRELNPHTAPIGSRGFYLVVNGYDDTRCHYAPTYGYTGFGGRKRKTTYPSGKIVIELPGNKQIDCFSLVEAKAKLAKALNSEYTSTAELEAEWSIAYPHDEI